MNIMDKVEKSDFDAFRRLKIEKFGLPSWLIASACPQCRQPLDWAGVDSISLETGAKHFGDLSFNYICPVCSSSTTRYFKAGSKTLVDFVMSLRPEAQPGKAAFRHEIPLEQNNLFNEYVEMQKKTETGEKT